MKYLADCSAYAYIERRVIMKNSCLIRLLWVSFLIAVPEGLCQTRDIEIIETRKRERSKGIKLYSEAEISCFTESLGFVNDRFTHFGTPWHNILRTFLNLKQGTEAHEIKITENYLEKGKKLDLCGAYLSDPIFAQNKIFLYTRSRNNPIRYEQKNLKFNYFSRRLEIVKVIRCPVMVNGKKSQLYFQEITFMWNAMFVHRGFFVFASAITSRNLPLELVMFTIYPSEELPQVDEAGEEAMIIDSVYPINLNLQIRFTINADMSNQRYRMRIFGEQVELYFLLKNYGLFNTNNRNWRMKELILILDRMRRGYELDSRKMEVEQTNDPNVLCDYYITDENLLLSQLEVFSPIQGQTGEAYWVLKSIKFPIIEISDDLTREILQCPATIGEKRELGYIYLLPVYYKNDKKLPQLIIFKNVDEKGTKVHPFAMFVMKEPVIEDTASIADFQEEQYYQTDMNRVVQKWDSIGASARYDPTLI